MSGTQLDPGLNLNRSATREYQRNGSIRFISHTQNRTEPFFSARFRFGSLEPVLMPRPRSMFASETYPKPVWEPKYPKCLCILDIFVYFGYVFGIHIFFEFLV